MVIIPNDKIRSKFAKDSAQGYDLRMRLAGRLLERKAVSLDAFFKHHRVHVSPVVASEQLRFTLFLPQTPFQELERIGGACSLHSH